VTGLLNWVLWSKKGGGGLESGCLNLNPKKLLHGIVGGVGRLVNSG
jgi:hypothetical protein